MRGISLNVIFREIMSDLEWNSDQQVQQTNQTPTNANIVDKQPSSPANDVIKTESCDTAAQIKQEPNIASQTIKQDAEGTLSREANKQCQENSQNQKSPTKNQNMQQSGEQCWSNEDEAGKPIIETDQNKQNKDCPEMPSKVQKKQQNNLQDKQTQRQNQVQKSVQKEIKQDSSIQGKGEPELDASWASEQCKKAQKTEPKKQQSNEMTISENNVSLWDDQDDENQTKGDAFKKKKNTLQHQTTPLLSGRNTNNEDNNNNNLESKEFKAGGRDNQTQGGRGGGFNSQGGRGGFNQGGRGSFSNQGGRGGFNHQGGRGGGFSNQGGRGGFNNQGGRGGFSNQGGRGRNFNNRDNDSENGGGRGGGRGGFNRDRDDGGFNRDRDGGGFRGRGRGGFNRDGGGFNRDRDNGGGFNRDNGGFNRDRDGGYNRNGGYNNRDDHGQRNSRFGNYGNSNQNNRQTPQNQASKILTPEPEGQTMFNFNQISVIETVPKKNPKPTQQYRINKTMNQQPIGLKCWPSVSIYIKKTKVSFFLSRIRDHICSILFFPYCEYSLDIYPGNIINQSSFNYKKKLKQKQKPAGQVYFQKCFGITQFDAFAFTKIEKKNDAMMKNSIKSLIISGSKLVPQFDSVLIPYSSDLGSLKEITAGVLQGLEENEKYNEIIISTNSSQSFVQASYQFLDVIKQLAENNQIVIE